MSEIRFTMDNGEEAVFYLLEQTVLGGITYLLVTDNDNEEEDADCFILKDVSSPDSEEACYVEVEDDNELQAVSRLFEEMLEDVEIV